MINFKSQKGSVTLFVITTCLFFTVAVTTVGMHMQSKKTAVDREYKQVKASYEKDLANAEGIYDEKLNFDNLAVYFSIPDINETDKNIAITVSLDNKNLETYKLRYGWISSNEEITPSSENVSDWTYIENISGENNVVANKKYSDDKDYYYLCVLINNKEFWPKAPVKISGDASYYGDQIDYDVDLGNNADGEPLNIVGTADYDWEIFYNDGTNIYIIAEDCVPLYYPTTSTVNPMMPTGINNVTSSYSTNPYSLYWAYNNGNIQNGKTGAVDIFGSGATPMTRYIANKYLSKWKAETQNSTYSNAKMTATLMDTSLWTSFTNSTKVSNLTTKVSELAAIGSPTIEMWVNSWNQKHGDISSDSNKAQLYLAATSTGYSIGIEENPTGAVINNSNATGYSDKLYYPRKSNYQNTIGYLLSSPSYEYNYRVMSVRFAGNIYRDGFNNPYYSVRPIVCLPSDITAQWDSGSNVWKIIKE